VHHALTGLLPLLAFVFVTLAVPVPVLGQGRGQGPPVTETMITTHFTKAIALTDTPPCVGTVTYDVRDVFHITSFGGEVAHVTDTQTGTLTFAGAADGKTYTGRFSGTFNLQANRANAAFTEVSTYHLRVQAPDGAQLRFWVTAHVTFAQPAQEPTVEFFNVRCTAR
jgi:hypothetical protein